MTRRHSLLLLLSLILLTGLATVRADDSKLLWRQGDPASVGMDANVLAELPERMQQFVDDHQVSGVVALIARRGVTVRLDAVGYADIENKTRMEPDSLFAIASMTKPITATAVMILQDDGKLSIDDPVSKYIPEFAEAALAGGSPSRPVTIRDMLTHTGGLGGDQRNEGTLEETAKKLAKRKLEHEPGTKWLYGPGLTVCGRVVEVASGQPFEEFLKERIFEPLKMKDTTFNPTDEQRNRLAKLYKPGKDGKSLELASHWISDASAPRTPNPSGGLFSTATDVARFYQMILNGGQAEGRQIVSEKSVQEMTRIQTDKLTTGFTPGNGWGLGWCVVNQPQGVSENVSAGTFGHGGALGTQGWVDPKRELIVVLMIQRSEFGNSDASDLRAALQGTAVEAIRD